MKKELRLAIYKKYECKCAYCGCVIIYKKMQVDHFWPQCRAHMKPNKDNNAIENLMPSCAKCNNHKHGFLIEEWREELERIFSNIHKDAKVSRAMRFGQLEIDTKPVVFYFERVNQ